ncbi:hypothetical protein EON66_07890, partial [archaeon]
MGTCASPCQSPPPCDGGGSAPILLLLSPCPLSARTLQADVLRGIALAVERIGQVPKYQPGLGRIIVVTDGRFASDDDELVVTLMAQVQALGIQLDVFGVN